MPAQTHQPAPAAFDFLCEAEKSLLTKHFVRGDAPTIIFSADDGADFLSAVDATAGGLTSETDVALLDLRASAPSAHRGLVLELGNILREERVVSMISAALEMKRYTMVGWESLRRAEGLTRMAVSIAWGQALKEDRKPRISDIGAYLDVESFRAALGNTYRGASYDDAPQLQAFDYALVNGLSNPDRDLDLIAEKLSPVIAEHGEAVRRVLSSIYCEGAETVSLGKTFFDRKVLLVLIANDDPGDRMEVVASDLLDDIIAEASLRRTVLPAASTNLVFRNMDRFGKVLNIRRLAQLQKAGCEVHAFNNSVNK